MLLKGKAALRQAEEAFLAVEQLNETAGLKRWDGPMNLARVYQAEGRLTEAVEALQRADAFREEEGYPRWTWAWLSGVINRQEGRLEEAVLNLRSALEDSTPETQRRKFDFRLDYEVRNLLGQTLFDLGVQKARKPPRDTAKVVRSAIRGFSESQELAPDNVLDFDDPQLQLLGQELFDLGVQNPRLPNRDAQTESMLDAIADFSKSHEADPKIVLAYDDPQLLQLCQMLFDLGVQETRHSAIEFSAQCDRRVS